jgi:hypothetical protein
MSGEFMIDGSVGMIELAKITQLFYKSGWIQTWQKNALLPMPLGCNAGATTNWLFRSFD